MDNTDLAKTVLSKVSEIGVKDFIICGGSRNIPFVAVLGRSSGVTLIPHFEERAAAFYALGLIKKNKRPVAVIVTSGTAVAELLPACIEAYYQNLPLVLISADRPKSYRGTGAPQSIDQKNIFNAYAHAYDFDVESNFSTLMLASDKPTHINVCFDEPLLKKKAEGIVVKENLSKPVRTEIDQAAIDRITDFLHLNPLIILGEILPEDQQSVEALCTYLGLPVYAEPLSGLRESTLLKDLLIVGHISDFKSFTAVLRIGGVPVNSFWRSLSLQAIQSLSIDNKPFSGAPNGALVQGPLSLICKQLLLHSKPPHYEFVSKVKETQLKRLIEKFPLSEPSLFYTLSNLIDAKDFVYLGNSLPIRQWGLTATHDTPHRYIAANRGANGIEGQISTFLGHCYDDTTNWCIIGDLTALYDLQSLWALQNIPDCKFRICIINNNGGQIFDRLPSKSFIASSHYEALVKTKHQMHFKAFADLWSVDYCKTHDLKNIAFTDRMIIEICPNAALTQSFWEEWDAL